MTAQFVCKPYLVGPDCADPRRERTTAAQQECLRLEGYNCLAALDACIADAFRTSGYSCYHVPPCWGFSYEADCLAQLDCFNGDANLSRCFCLVPENLICTVCDPGAASEVVVNDITSSSSTTLPGAQSLTASSYLIPIPITFGSTFQVGNIIWMGNQRVTTLNITTVVAGQNVTTQEQVGMVDFALAISAPTLAGIQRLWIDNVLVIDNITQAAAQLNATYAAVGFGYTLYNGADGQVPDAILQAGTGDELTPAYRDLAYIVFRNFPASLTSSFPTIRLQVAEASDATAVQYTQSALGFSVAVQPLNFDAVSQSLMLANGSTLTFVDALTYAVLKTAAAPAAITADTMFLSAQGDAFMQVAGGDLVYFFGGDYDVSLSLAPGVPSYAAGAGTGAALEVFTTGYNVLELAAFAIGTAIYLVTVDKVVNSISLAATLAAQTSGTFVRMLLQDVYGSDAYVRKYMYAVAQEGSSVAVKTATLTDLANNIGFTASPSITSTSIGFGALGVSNTFVLKDAVYAPDALIFLLQDGGSFKVARWNIATNTVAWSSAVGALPTQIQLTPGSDIMAYAVAGTLYSINLVTGAVTTTAITTPGAVAGTTQLFSSALNALLYISSTNQVVTYFGQRVAAKGGLIADIAARIGAELGFAPNQVQTTDVTTFIGYTFNRDEALTSALKILADFASLSIFETNGSLLFQAKTSAGAVAVSNQNSLSKDLQEKRGSRRADITYVNVGYIDSALYGIDATQLATRDVCKPFDNFVSDATDTTYSIPAVMSANNAKVLAERLLMRDTQLDIQTELYVGPALLTLEPGDYVVVDGELAKRRITQVDLDPTMMTKVVTQSDDAEIYGSQPAVVGVQTGGQSIGNYNPVSVIRNYPILFNLPALNDAGSIFENDVNFVGEMNPFGPQPLTPAYVRTVSTGARLAGTPSKEVAWGRLQTVPDLAISSDGETDLVSSMVVKFAKSVTGAFTSLGDVTGLITDPRLNLLFIGNEAIQFQTASVAGDNVTATFTGLLRGRWGTDAYMRSHVTGEMCAVYDAPSLISYQTPVAARPRSVVTGAALNVTDTAISRNASYRFISKATEPLRPLRVMRADQSGIGIFFGYELRLRGMIGTDTELVTPFTAPTNIPQTMFILRSPFSNITAFLSDLVANAGLFPIDGNLTPAGGGIPIIRQLTAVPDVTSYTDAMRLADSVTYGQTLYTVLVFGSLPAGLISWQAVTFPSSINYISLVLLSGVDHLD